MEKYLGTYRNATKEDKEIIELCLDALTCVVEERSKLNSLDLRRSDEHVCQNVEQMCITSKTNLPKESFPNVNSGPTAEEALSVISSDRLAITYIEGGDEWSFIQRRHLLECKIEHLLCELHPNEGELDNDIYEESYTDISLDIQSPNDYLDSEQKCVNGMPNNYWIF